jgi:hypothetical protein
VTIKDEGWLVVKGVGAYRVTNRFEDYRDVAGVKIAFKTVGDSDATGRIVVQYQEAEATPKLPDDAFATREAPK